MHQANRENQTNNDKKGYSFSCTVNGMNELIRFSPFTMNSERSPYEIQQEYGLDKDGKISKDFVPFKDGSTESLLIEVVKTGKIERLVDAGLVLCERPQEGNISRNLAVYDPKSGFSYTIGGLGFIAPNAGDKTHFTLKDPLLDQKYQDYQKKLGNKVGGTQLVNDDGFQSIPNKSIVGTIEYNTGPYHVVRKMLENEKLQRMGINAPTFIAVGPILNLADGKFGFSIYRGHLTPEYLLNLSIFLDKNANFKKNYQIFLESKYGQLVKLHREIGETHGQPSNTNTLSQINIFEEHNNLSCQVKDFETNHPIPSVIEKKIEDGLCPLPVGYRVRKSPHAAALIYDLQHCLTQELNILYIPSRFTKNVQEKFNYISNNAARLLRSVAKIYDIASDEESQKAIDFAIHRYYEVIKKGVDLDRYNEIIAGVFVHKWFSLSPSYCSQVSLTQDLR